MAEEQEKPKNKKIGKMTLAEVETALKKTEEHMQGLSSRYAQALLARKAELSA
ncbi:MAG: hypothetical protein H7A21_20370 [Spirochaetales bacterium]|nr:hypothetical protein [Leptospiraceae bacterium]MCP5483806.1 hypothetical protein [Spirochaetales bacterium]